MISITDIKQGIALTVNRALRDCINGEIVVSDEPYKHVNSPAFLVKVVSARPEMFSTLHVQQIYRFDLIYLPPMQDKKRLSDEIAHKLLAGLYRPIEFANRFILPDAVSLEIVDNDYHLMFDLNFFDALPQDQAGYEYMQNLEFRLELGAKGA